MVIYTLVIVEIQNSVTQTMATSAQGICIFLKKQKLRNFFTETPKFREPQPSNYSSCKKEIDPAIEEFAGSLRIKHKLENTAMDLWVNKVKEKVENRIKSLKKSKFTMLLLYCKMKTLSNKLKFFNQNFVLSPLIKHQTSFSLVRISMFLSC